MGFSLQCVPLFPLRYPRLSCFPCPPISLLSSLPYRIFFANLAIQRTVCSQFNHILVYLPHADVLVRFSVAVFAGAACLCFIFYTILLKKVQAVFFSVYGRSREACRDTDLNTGTNSTDQLAFWPESLTPFRVGQQRGVAWKSYGPYGVGSPILVTPTWYALPDIADCLSSYVTLKVCTSLEDLFSCQTHLPDATAE